MTKQEKEAISRATFWADYPGLNRLIRGTYPNGCTFLECIAFVAALDDRTILYYIGRPR